MTSIKLTAASTGHTSCHHAAYGMSCEEYEALRARSGSRCELCDIPESETPQGMLYIDHDHRYGDTAVRGLICAKCNSRMRFVDSGERPAGPVELRYIRGAWFVFRDPSYARRARTYRRRTRRAGRTLSRTIRVDDALWEAFGVCVEQQGEPDRSEVIRQFIGWYIRAPKSKLPKRPPAPTQTPDNG